MKRFEIVRGNTNIFQRIKQIKKFELTNILQLNCSADMKFGHFQESLFTFNNS